MKLYTEETTHKSSLSLEQYRQMFETSDVISQESLSDFLYKIADAFNTVYTTIIAKYSDDDVKEIFSSKLEVQNKVKNLDFTMTSENIVTVPENFKGKYIDYITDLHSSASDLYKLTIESGDLTKMALADFINNSNLDKLNTLYGFAKVELQSKIAQKHKDKIANYFPYNNGVDKASLRTVLKTYADVKPILEYVEKLDQLVNKDTLQNVNILYNNISDLLNHLIAEVGTQNIKINNTSIKKDLEKMLYNFNNTMTAFGYTVYNIKNFYMALLKDVNTLVEM
jgi:hypothetical protein